MYAARPTRTYLVPSIVTLSLLFAATFAFAAGALPGVHEIQALRGVPQVGARGVSWTVADIMREEAARASEPAEEIELENEHQMPNRSGLPLSPLALRAPSVPAMPADQLTYHPPKVVGHSALAPQTPGVSFTGATLATTGSFPPDNDGAVGPTQYVIAVNGRIVTYNKATGVADGVLNATTNTFFTNVRNGSGTSDPMIRFDRATNRWFVTIINVAANQNRWLLEVSDAASNGVISASTVWTGYFFQPAAIAPVPTNSTTMFSDYPTLGIDANALYVGVDEFAGTGQPFQQCDAFVIRKSSVLSGGPIVVTAFRGLMSSPAVGGNYSGPFAPRGVDSVEPGTNEGYLIGSDGNSFGNFWLVRIANPGGTPTMSQSMIPVLAENWTRPVVHPGNTGGYWGYLDNLDDRYFQATIRNQQLWTVHNIDVDNTGVSQGTYTGDTRSAARWYHFNVPVNSGAPTIVESGTVFTASASNDSVQKQYFMPSLTVSGQGHVAMGFSTAGTSNFVNVEAVGRLASDPPGTMQAPVQITSNTANTYNPTSDPGGISAGRPRRWGDYTQTTLDPLDDMTMWTVQQFVDANNSYGCRVVQLKAPPPATPNALADVVPGQASVSVTLTGASLAGSGFYDPGPNLPSPARPFNHLAAAITNGGATGTPPTVVSATYVNPTTVNLVLNTTSATANLPGEKYTITITNPDGQAAAGAVVHVVNTTITASAGAGGSITPSGAISVPFGSNQSFSIAANPCFSISDVLVDGSSVGAVTSYTFTSVTTNHTIAASFAPGLTNAVTTLAASQVKTGNGGSGTTGITLTYALPLGSTSVEVWRKGFGSYPLFATPPGTGGVPSLPGAYPPAGWTQVTGVTASGQADQPGTRDYWYYVAYGRDTCGDVSPVSNMTGGTLDYHLGDFSDGITQGQGDNTVNTADASLLGANYGLSGGALAGLEYLDVGPTTTNTTDGRPTVDGVVDFEDLVMLALNYAPHVSAPNRALPAAGRPAGELVSVSPPLVVEAGTSFDVPVTLTGSGELQALSLALAWDPAVAVPTGVSAGEMMTSRGGVVFSPGPGRADAALLGVGADGLSGRGTVAVAHFRALQAGAPNIGVAKVIGRDAVNHDVTVAIQTPLGVAPVVTATDLMPVIPNPMHGTSLIQYSLVQRGAVNVAIYSVDGRLVRTLAHGVQDAGRYQFTWDGADAHGSLSKSGMYFVRLEAAGTRKTRVLSVIR